ncbi:hypothetical protein [Dyadobacter sp. CY312]|uniref:hypothetical protein n=1 Tax=Dyadobacter sp. CY312 TaxID=2907303 RepID=UPI001F25F36D|nr:hypothetical protein [Dyadobacter sp. CY312]MCE7042525.1 hypothetical protein [Dyadobacter sp. CY312]
MLNSYLKDKADYTVPERGLAIWIQPKQKQDWSQISEKMASSGIKILPPDHYSNDSSNNGIRLGYGSLSETDLKEGIMLLARHLVSLCSFFQGVCYGFMFPGYCFWNNVQQILEGTGDGNADMDDIPERTRANSGSCYLA